MNTNTNTNSTATQTGGGVSTFKRVSAKTRTHAYETRKRAANRNQVTFDPTMERRAVIYVRISEDFNRDKEMSTSIQEERCRHWAMINNITVVDVLVEKGESAFAGKSPRPKFKRALHMIETNAANVLMVYKLNRFMRDASRAVKVKDDIHSWGGSIISITESVDTAAAVGELKLIADLTFNLLVQLAEQESVSKSEVMTDVHHGTIHRVGKDAGKKALAPNGPAPYGYKKCMNDDKERSLSIVDDEAEVIRNWADRIINGATLGDLRGTYNGRTFMNRGGIKHILTSPVTAGLRSADGETHVEGNWPAILDQATSNKVCAILLNPDRFSGGVRGVRMHLLSGMIDCHVCGKKLRAINNRQGGPRYQCVCYNSMPVKQVDEMVKDFLFDTVDDETWNGVRSQGRAYDPTVVARFEERLADIMKEYALGEISKADRDVARATIKEAMAKLETTEYVELPNITNVKTDWAKMDIDAKRLVIAAFIESISMVQYKKDKSQTRDERLIIKPKA